MYVLLQATFFLDLVSTANYKVGHSWVKVEVVMRNPCIFFSIVILALGNSIGAQAPPQRDPEAAAILRESCLAMGGPVASGISDMTLLGNVTEYGDSKVSQGAFSFKLNGPEKNRTDFTLDGRVVASVINGTKGAEHRGTEQKRLPYHAILNRRPEYVPMLTEVCEWGNPLYRAEFLGLESLDGRSVYHIRVEKEFPGRKADRAAILSELSAADLFVDSTAFLLIKRSRRVPSIANLRRTILVEQTYQDFRPISSVVIPHRVITYVRGQKASEVIITSVSFNTGLSPAEFEVR